MASQSRNPRIKGKGGNSGWNWLPQEASRDDFLASQCAELGGSNPREAREERRRLRAFGGQRARKASGKFISVRFGGCGVWRFGTLVGHSAALARKWVESFRYMPGMPAAADRQ